LANEAKDSTYRTDPATIWASNEEGDENNNKEKANANPKYIPWIDEGGK
jgi:hypothetical protein